MKKNQLFIYINIFLILAGQGFAQSPDSLSIVKAYKHLLDSKVQIYRITRDKAYEIYYPEFDLIQIDLADAVNIMEDNFMQLEDVLSKTGNEREYNSLLDVWNNIRYYTLVKPTRKNFNKYYYDAKTFEAQLNVLLKKLEDQYPDIKHFGESDHFKLYAFRAGVFLINTGYLIDKFPINKSLQQLFESELNKAETLLQYAKEKGYFQMNKNPFLLAKMLNNWKFFKYNLHNPLFRTDRLLFSLANILNHEVEKLHILVN